MNLFVLLAALGSTPDAFPDFRFVSCQRTDLTCTEFVTAFDDEADHARRRCTEQKGALVHECERKKILYFCFTKEPRGRLHTYVYPSRNPTKDEAKLAPAETDCLNRDGWFWARGKTPNDLPEGQVTVVTPNRVIVGAEKNVIVADKPARAQKPAAARPAK